MKIPRIELFEWLRGNHERADYVLAFSKMKGLSKREYDELVQYDLGPELDLGRGDLHGANEFKQILMEIYGCEFDNIVTTSGGTQANCLVFLSTLNKKDEFIIEQPGYQPMWLTPEMMGARKIPWPRRFEDGFRLNVDALEDLITNRTKLIVLTNPNNPTGVVADRELEIKKVAEIAQDKGIYVLIDEIFIDGADKPQVSAYGLPNVIITSSMTKVYGLGGQRTGWIIAPQEIASECQHAKSHTNGSSSYLGEMMNAYALRNARKVLLQRFNKLSISNFQILSKWMEANQDIVEWVLPHGGIMCFPRYRVDMSSIELCQKLLDDHKVMVNPGEYFNMDGHIRLGYACPEDILRNGLDAMGKGLRKLGSC
jgi:aspartate/methionine/tyrosine aminotransferase